MSFKQNDTITLNNYEEYFILYTDNELTASQQTMVDSFVLQHPHLAEELEMLLGTKLPLYNLPFTGKEELLSPAMKLNTVDESLLLYVDNELSSAEKVVVASRIESDAGYALQHALLLQTKLNAADVVSHPDKKELYRHERRTVPFGMWLRIAAAVVLLLISTWFFFLNKTKQDDGSMAGKSQSINTKPAEVKKPLVIEQLLPKEDLSKEATASSKQPTVAPLKKVIKTTTPQDQNTQQDVVSSSAENSINNRREVIRIDASRFATEQKTGDVVTINEFITHTSVTSLAPVRNTPVNPDGTPTDWDFKDTKKTPARGFFRKVSRFIERNTGIGTANADNELLVGAVALKLK